MQKTEMLKKNYEFRKVLAKGKYCSGKCIETFVIKNNTNRNKIGIAIGVKLGKAFQSNYVKRLIRENYRKIENKIDTGYEIVFLWKKKVEMKSANYENVKEDMEKIFSKIGMIK